MQCGVQCITAWSMGHSALQHEAWGTVHYSMQHGAQCITACSMGHCITACSVGHSALQHAVWGTVHYSMQHGVQCITACSVGHTALQHEAWGAGLLIPRFNSKAFQFLSLRVCNENVFETDMSVRYCPPSCLVIETPCFLNWFCLYDHGKVEPNRWDLRFPQHKTWGFRFHWLLCCCCSAQQCSRFFLLMTLTEQIYTFT
jgi:hypothetical protein